MDDRPPLTLADAIPPGKLSDIVKAKLLAIVRNPREARDEDLKRAIQLMQREKQRDGDEPDIIQKMLVAVLNSRRVLPAARSGPKGPPLLTIPGTDVRHRNPRRALPIPSDTEWHIIADQMRALAAQAPYPEHKVGVPAAWLVEVADKICRMIPPKDWDRVKRLMEGSPNALPLPYGTSSNRTP